MPTERARIIEMIDEAVVAGAGLLRACEEAAIDRRTYRRWSDPDTGTVRTDARPDAVRPVPSNRIDDAVRAEMLELCCNEEFADAPPSQIVPVLADRGLYLTSESTYYRVLHEADRQHERGRARRRTMSTVTSHCAKGPNRLWAWDVTWLASPTRGRFFYLHMIVDIWSRKIVGWEVNEVETGELAAELVTRATLAERCANTARVLHADNGSPQRSSTLRTTLGRLGIRPSSSRPRVSDDNAYIESLFRTAKYRPGFPAHGFSDITATREWVLGFVGWYNTEHRHSAIRFVTPARRHAGEDIEIPAARKQLYEVKKHENPSRWSGATRDWTAPHKVWLNPERSSDETESETRNAA